MKGHAENEVFNPYEVATARIAWIIVDEIPDKYEGIRCHELVRLVHDDDSFLAGRAWVVDGKFGHVEHSWLEIHYGQPNMIETGTILDVYAVGRTPMVQLIDMNQMLPYHKLYRKGRPRNDIDWDLIREIQADLKESRLKRRP